MPERRVEMISTTAYNVATHDLPAFANAEDEADRDSAFGGDDTYIGADTVSLASFITDYRYENGRTYHAYQDGAYWGPNDEHAQEHQDLAHHLYLLTFGGRLHFAPVRNPQRVMDVGCGTGIWAIGFADDHPQCHVTGADLSPIQPTFAPANCTFEVDDLTQPWTHPASHFDLIHIREMFGSIPDWDAFLSTCYTHTKPGGWVEIVEHSVVPVSDDGTVGPDHFFTRWGQTILECGEANGKTFGIWEESKGRMEQAGFVGVRELRFRWPMNSWPRDERLKELGRWNQLRLWDGVEGMVLRLLTRAVGWSYERAQAFIAEMREALQDFETHAYLEGTVVFGQKP